MVEHGMTPIAALKAATSVDAELLGLSKTIGTIEPASSPISSRSRRSIADISATERVVRDEGGKVVVAKRP